jgi:hypothetical protein
LIDILNASPDSSGDWQHDLREKSMIGRCMYIWKLGQVLAAEGGANKLIDKARRAKLSAIWVKVADGTSTYANVSGAMAQTMTDLVTRAHARGLQIWGWQVPHCVTTQTAQAEATTFGNLVQQFQLDGFIMDAEGGKKYFQGGVAEAQAYGNAMRQAANNLNKPLGISSNDIPQNISADWPPRFSAIAANADFNFPQTYYGASSSVAARIDKAVTANAHLTIPFVPVGAGFIGLDEGGCESAQACGERAATFIQLCKSRAYQGYSFWHWGGAPLSLWEVLNNTPA